MLLSKSISCAVELFSLLRDAVVVTTVNFVDVVAAVAVKAVVISSAAIVAIEKDKTLDVVADPEIDVIVGPE